jgi:hypothetical protein
MNRLKFKDFRKITYHLRGIWRIYLKLRKKKRTMSTCNQLDFETLGSQPIVPKNLPGYCSKWGGSCVVLESGGTN